MARAALAFAVALAAFATYFDPSDREMVWDDRAAIVGNKDVNGERNISAAFWHDFWGAPMDSKASHKSYRPLTVLSFRANYAFSGTDASGYHFTNVCLHSLLSALIYLLAEHILSCCGRSMEDSEAQKSAFFAGILFAVHPVHAEAVGGLVGRADLLGGLFFVLAFSAYIKVRDLRAAVSSAYFALAFVFAGAATLCKESGFAVLGCCLVWDVFMHAAFFRGGDAASKKFIVRTALLFALSSALLKVRLSLHGEAGLHEFDAVGNHLAIASSRFSRALSYGYVHARYALLLVWPCWPWALCYDHGFAAIPVIESVWRYENAITLAAYGALYLIISSNAAAFSRKVDKMFKARAAAALVCVVLAGAPFLPASHIFFPIGAVLAERLMYIPSIGFCLLGGSVLGRFAERLKTSGVSKALCVALTVLCCGFLLLCGYHANRTAHAWRNERALFEAGYEAEPKSVKVLNNLGQLLLSTGAPEDRARARRVLEEALVVHPGYAVASANLGLVYKGEGNFVKAAEMLRKALELDSSLCKMRAYLGISLSNLYSDSVVQGKPNISLANDAKAFLNQSYHECPYPFGVLAQGSLHSQFGEYELALHYYERTSFLNRVAAKPGMEWQLPKETLVHETSLRNMMGLTLARIPGREQDALQQYQMALNAGGDIFPVLVNAASMQTQLGSYNDAIRLLGIALDMKPESPEALTNLGFAFENKGDLKEAQVYYKKAYAILPSNRQIATNVRSIERLLLHQARAAEGE